MSDSDKIAHLAWVNEQIAADERSGRIAQVKKKTKLVIPMSWRRADLYRKMIAEIFGDTCHICGFKGRLELSHLYYAEDSVEARSTGAHALRRLIEAIQHPERFRRLCSVCHDIFDHGRRHGGVEYLRKIEALMVEADEKGKIHGKNRP